MNFGYFDDDNREYVITKPNTPAPWCNYLGSPEYGAIISNNAVDARDLVGADLPGVSDHERGTIPQMREELVKS